MKLELVWMVLPITGLLSQFGGTWWKAYRRYFIPIIAVIAAWIFEGNFFWGYIPMMLHMYGAFTLPVTKFGNSIPNDKRNWLWLPIRELLICSSVLWLSISYWPVCVVLGLIMTIFIVLSNIKATAKWFQWKFVEMVEGIVALMPLCYFLTKTL